jgi:hypothetical protein
LVFAHPNTGKPMDRTKVARRFQEACVDARLRVITFHELRHTFATRMAAQGVPLRKLQEWLGHADIKPSQIYMHYALDEHEIAIVNDAFARESVTTTSGDDPPSRTVSDPQASAIACPRWPASRPTQVLVPPCAPDRDPQHGGSRCR